MRAMIATVVLTSLAAWAAAHGGHGPLNTDPKLARHFEEAGVKGSIVIVEPHLGKRFEVEPALNAQPYLPASTFKIPNSLIALDSNMVRDVDTVLKWDGVDRGSAGWNKDLSMREALRVSAVWYYQELARRVGEKRMQEMVTKLDYGNRKAGPKVDTFWLDGGLRITPNQQIEFLQRLHDGKLSVSQRSMFLVREIMERDRGDGWVLRAKSGWAIASKPETGWWVGWLEHGEECWYFALRIDIEKDEQAPLREKIVRACLADLGLLPAP